MRRDCLSRSLVVRFAVLLAAWLGVFASARASADLARYNDAVVRVDESTLSTPSTAAGAPNAPVAGAWSAS
mgnify:CR=1 FL=1